MEETSLDRCIPDQSDADINLNEEESDFAQQLKDVSYKDGKELDLEKSAQILHKLVKVYHKRSSGMFNLIRSAALYNAAIVRFPSNVVEVENDLRNLCKDALVKAANTNADLIERSKCIKQTVVKMKKHAEECLETIEVML